MNVCSWSIGDVEGDDFTSLRSVRVDLALRASLLPKVTSAAGPLPLAATKGCGQGGDERPGGSTIRSKIKGRVVFIEFHPSKISKMNIFGLRMSVGRELTTSTPHGAPYLCAQGGGQGPLRSVLLAKQKGRRRT
jgi:hypothetical protein